MNHAIAPIAWSVIPLPAGPFSATSSPRFTHVVIETEYHFSSAASATANSANPLSATACVQLMESENGSPKRQRFGKMDRNGPTMYVHIWSLPFLIYRKVSSVPVPLAAKVPNRYDLLSRLHTRGANPSIYSLYFPLDK